jgi:hypothetical protein
VWRGCSNHTRRLWGDRKARCRGQVRIATDVDTRAAAINLARGTQQTLRLGLRHQISHENAKNADANSRAQRAPHISGVRAVRHDEMASVPPADPDAQVTCRAVSGDESEGVHARLRGLRGPELLRVARARAWIILGLSGLAVAQPLLDLFGRNPEFFVAGNYSSTQIVLFALVIVLVPPFVGVAAVAVSTFVDRRAGTVVFGLVTATLAGALVLAVLRTAGVDATVLVFALAVFAGAAVVLLVLRTRGAQLLVSYLAVANVAFLASFLFLSRSSELIIGGSSASADELGSVDVPALNGPVVVIVLDEFPAATILRGDGTINAERYPGFADLASVSTWFRNASSNARWTHLAVPSVLTGRVAKGTGRLPVYQDYPRNLFTLFGGDAPVRRYESITDLCPTSICAPPPPEPLRQALEDALIVYGHRLLPSSLRGELPPIDNSWGAYGAPNDIAGGSAPDDTPTSTATLAERRDRVFALWHARAADERSPRGQANVLADEIAAIDGTPGLHFVHSVLPHFPFLLSRAGLTTSSAPPDRVPEGDPTYAFWARLRYQLHSMQVGAVDRTIAELLDHLRSLPTWEQTLLVVTSDHGDNHTPPDIGRRVLTRANREEVLRVPLFIKAPGQVDGEIVDRPAQTIDILPSIVDLVDAKVDWGFDGHSLYDGSPPHVRSRVSRTVDALLQVAAERAQEFPYGDDWTALAAVGEDGDLVGRRVSDLAIGDPSRYRATLTQEELLRDLPTPDGTMPFVLVGEVAASGGSADEPPELLAAVNGTLAGVVGGYEREDDGWRFMGYVADFYEEGANRVDLYEVERSTGTPVLHAVLAAP